jgi:AcrR family transcriptional regulator
VEPGSPREKRRDDRKAQVVQVARDLFLEQKLETVKMTDIADRAGIGVASLYRYFDTKETIVIAAATLLWREIKEQYLPGLASERFQAQSGILQIRGILELYSQLLAHHQPFLRFLSDFDAYCIQNRVPKARLAAYERSINDFYRPYLTALKKGQADGTVAMQAEPRLVYLTVNHTMLSLLKKITAGEILLQDADNAQELDIMKQIILRYFEA